MMNKHHLLGLVKISSEMLCNHRRTGYRTNLIQAWSLKSENVHEKALVIPNFQALRCRRLATDELR